MENNVDVKSVLEELGYKLVDCGDSWRTSAIYRGGDNPTAVKVYKNTGVWTDYVHANKSMPLAALVQRIHIHIIIIHLKFKWKKHIQKNT